MKKKTIVIVLLLCLSLVLSGCGGFDATQPISGFHEFWDIFVYPIAGLMWLVSKTVAFGNYAVTIVISTLIVRTLAWPIYAKSNDLQLKMKLVEPEVAKIQKKYADKTDRESQQRMQMEQMQLYKKYGIGLSGCITPLIQMPIFLGFYRTIARMPACITAGNWVGKTFKTTEIFGVDLVLRQNQALVGTEITEVAGWTSQRIGVLVLAILVGVTQLLSIILSNRRQKRQNEKRFEGVPEYRRPQKNKQQSTTEKTMKFMLYFMAAMMVVFVWSSAAGLGLYWVVGNIYTTLQSWIGEKQSEKRLEKLRIKHARVNK